MSDMVQELAKKGHHFHPSTIYGWAAKCDPLMDAYTKKFSPWTGFKWCCDEICHKIH